MVDIDVDDLEEEDSTLTEADQAVEANKSVTEELKAFKDRKEALKEEREAEEEQEEEKEEKPKKKSTLDLTKLNAFKSKLIKELGLEESVDSNGCFIMKYNGILIFKLLPRKNCWYGLWTEIPQENNKWRAVRVYSAEEEGAYFNHAKELVNLNKK